MKRFIAKGLVSFTFIFGCLTALMGLCALPAMAATTTTKTVTWELPAGWDAEVAYPLVQGYRAIVGDGELLSRTDIGAIADPDLPYYRIRVALPSNATFGQAACEVEWEKVDLGGALPLPVAQPVPTSSEVTYPAPGPAYATVYPAQNVKVEFLQIMNDVRMMPITVTPFRWDGEAKQLYKAKKLKVTATYTVPATRLRLSTSSVSSAKTTLTDFQKMALSMTINPEDVEVEKVGGGGQLKLSTSTARSSIAYFGNDNEADYVIISPHEFIDLWKAFAEFRKTTANGASHTFCVTDTRTIYAQYDNVDGDDALKIHRYIEDLYKISPRKIKYVLLGAAAKKYQYDRETMIPARYIVCSGSLCQMLDMYYGCMDRMPVGVGVEVWDYDGDGAYLGHKNANGTYSQDSNAYIDWQQDLAVFRFPMMREVVESGTKLTAPEIMTNFINKVKHLESEDYPDRYSAIYTGSTGFSTSTYGSVGRGEMYGLIIDEREFFDQGLNIFSPEHPSWASDSEYVPRDHGWEFLTYMRGNRKVLMNNSSYNTCSYADIYRTSGEFLDTVCHGWARGAVGAVGAGEVFTSTGYYTIFDCAVPCDTGMYDYCPGGSYGITNTICVGEAPALAPKGGGLASINNTRYGWSATGATSYNNGNGNHSFRLSWLFLRALTGVKSWSESKTYQPMNAGEALMWAHNMHGTPYATAAWGLSGAEVTGQGDPIARLSLQYERTWNPADGNHDWSTNAANWSVEGKAERGVFDVSRNVYLPLTGKGSETFCVSNTFTTAGFFVEQDANATLTLKGEGSFKSLRETVITNGNVRWEVAGGVGRNGIKFVGARGNIELPGNAKRYFGECFSNVGTISVSGGNVVIDTPRNFNISKSGLDISGKIDWSEIEFVAQKPEDVTEYNQLRSRTPGIFKTSPEKHLRVVNSKLSLQTYNLGGTGSGSKDKPLLFVTNSTVKVQANPLWKEEYFVRPTYLDNSTIIGDYDKFAFGPADGTTGYDLYVSGKCAISGDKPIKLNGELRVHFLGEGAELEIANALCDGTKPGTVSFVGNGKVKISATQTFTNPLVIPNGVTLEGAIAKLSTGAIEIQSGATANFTLIPLQGVQTLTLDSGATVNLPGETGNGIYQVVDSAVTTLVDNGAKFYDVSTTPATEVVGDISEGYLLKTANILFWKGTSGIWDKSDSTVWTNATGEATKYSDGVPLCFADGASSPITVTVGEAVAPGFMDFRNHTSRYTFSGNYDISLNSLAIGTGVTFDAPLKLANTLKVTAGETVVNNIETPSVEVANGGTLRVKGEMTVPTQKIKKLKFSFAATKDSGNVAAIQELRLFNKSGFFRLPNNTIIRDIADQSVTITGPKDEYGHTMTGHTGDEQIGALVDGKITGNNKWWASNKKAPTWFEIEFPTEVDAITGYDFFTADSAGRNPKAWSVYTAAAGKEYALSATKSDVVDGTAHHWMIGDGTAGGALYPLINVNGFAEVKAGGTLVLDGELYANVSLEANAILAIEEKNCLTNKSQLATLTLPESGTVRINLDNATESVQTFPILVGYNLTNEQLAKFECMDEDGMLVIKNGDLYAATQSEKPPYRATAAASGTWSGLTWQNANGVTFDWKTANRKPDAKVELTVSGTPAIDVDVGETIGELQILGSGAVTFTSTLDEPLKPSHINDATHTGLLDWQLPTGSAAVTAGSDTCIRSGAEGKGLLTVGSGMKVTLGTGVTFANRAIDADGWVRFEGTRTNFELAGYDPSNYSFTNGLLTGSFVLDRHTIRSRANDYVKLIGSEANYYARSLLNFDITGGMVEIETNGDNTWFGRTGTPSNEGGAATVFNQSGGTFRCLATGTGAGGGLLTGYEGGTDAGYEFYLNLTGTANFEVPSSYLNFGNPTIVTLLGNAHMKAKGYIASMSPGTINLGTNSTDSVVMEVGSLGLNSGAANLTMYKNSAIVGFEDGAFIEGGITLRAAKRSTTDDTMTVAAADNTTLTLRNLTFAFYVQEGATGSYNGSETVIFGNSTKGWTGTVKVENASCLPVYWKVAGGTVDLGDIRYASGSTLKTAPSGGVVKFTLTDLEYESGMAIDLIKCDSWVNGKTSDQLKAYFNVYLANGTLADGTLSAANGTVTYIPKGGASEYVYPLTATVDGNKNWTALTWTDRNGKAYAGDWSNVRSAQLVNNGGDYTVTMDKSISMLALNTQVATKKKLTINNGTGYELTLTLRFNDETSAGTTVANIALAEGVTIYAGKDLQLNGSMDESTSHGTLVIGASNKATVNNGYWNGEVEMADSTAALYFSSTTPFTKVPCSLNPNSMGQVYYNATLGLAGSEVNFGSDSAKAADGRFIVRSAMTCADLFVGRGNNSIVGFDVNGGSLTMAKDTHDGQWVLAQDAGSQVTTWIYPSATISAPDTTLWVGKGGSATLHLGNGITVKGLVNDAVNSGASQVLLYYGKSLVLGSGGINFTSTASESFYVNGTIKITEDASITVTPALANAVMKLEAPADVTMTVNSPIVRSVRESSIPALDIIGEGTVILNGRCSFGGNVNLNAGTLILSAYGLLGNSPVVFNGGKIIVELTLAQVRAKVGNNYGLFQTSLSAEDVQQHTTVRVKETGSTVSGVWTKSGNTIMFKPADNGDITAEITEGGTHEWTTLGWRDAQGEVDPSVWDSVVGNVLLTNAFNSTVTLSKNITLATLRLYNSGTLAIDGLLTADGIDDSRSTGQTTIHSESTIGTVKAGADTILESSGSGTLTIESGKKATSKVAYQGNISNTGTYVYDYPVTAMNSFTDNRQYAGGGTAGGTTYSSGTLRLVKGAYTYGGRFAIVTATADVSGDTTTVTAPTFVMGDGSNANSTFNLSGGTFEVTGSGTPTSTSASILLAHWSSTINMNVKGGTFIATNAAVRLGWDGTANVSLGTDTTPATMRVKGIKSGSERNNAASFTLGANGTLELGDFGLQALGSSAVYNLNGGKIVAFADSQVKATTADKIAINGPVTFAAETGKTLTVNADFAGDGTITCGESGKDGTVLFLNGTYADSTITGTFTIRMTQAQQTSGAAVTLCKTPDTTVVETVTVQLADGNKAPGTVKVEGGNLVWTPPECTMPLRATVTGEKTWAQLTWHDSSETPQEIPTSFWPLLKDLALDVTVTEGAVLTMPTSTQKVSDDLLTVNGTGTIVVDNLWPTYKGLTDSTKWQGTLCVKNKTGCAGLNFVYLGNSASTVEVNNVSGWFEQADVTDANPYGVIYPYTLKVVGTGLTINNGTSYKGFAFENVTGDGPINFGNSGGDPRIRLVLKNVAAYTGTLTVLGKGGVTLGSPTARISDGTIVFYDGCVAPGKTWTAPNGVTVDGKLTMTPNEVKPFNCALSFNSGSTLNVTQTEAACESIPLTTGTLTLDLDNTTLTFQDVEATGEWTVAAGYVVKTVELTAEVGGFAMDEHQNDKIIKAAGVAGGYFTVGSPLHPVSFTTKAGETVDIKFQGDGQLELAGGLDATAAAVTLDASGLSGEDLAKCAVHGAPYSRWLVHGALSGTVEITGVPTMPFGYTVEKQVLAGYGARLIVTAPDYAMFEAISVNLRKDTALESTDVLSGLYPVARKYWGDLAVANNAQVVVSNVTFKLSSSVSGYGLNNTPPDMIYKQYLDDNASTRTISITGVPYAQYRILVYFSTDLANNNFRPMKVNDDWYAGQLAQNVESRTVKGRNDVWGHTGPDHNANNPAEGVNVLCTDVYTGNNVTLSFTRNGGAGARATPCAIQIVKVGEFVDIKPRTLYAKSGTTEFTDETEVLDAKGATTTLSSFDTLVITNALTAKFNFTDVKLMEIRIDVPNETVTVNNGDGTGYYAFDGETVSITNGTLKLNCDNHGDANIRDTVFNLGEHGELINTGWFTFDGTVTINSDYDKEVLKNTGNPSSIKGSGKLSKGGSGTITLASKPQGQPIEVVAGVLNLPDDETYTLGAISGTGTLNVPADAVITMGTLANGTVITGSGTLVSSNGVPNASNASFQNSAKWTGTMWFQDVTLGGNSLNSYCNANSVLRFTGVKGWLRNDPANQGVPKLELVDDGDKLAFEVTDSSQNRAYTFDKLIGGGTLRFATKASSACVMVLGDVSEFTGKLLSTAGTGTTARPIFIGSSGTAGSSSLISVAADKTVKANCGWQAASVAFDVTLNVIGAEGDTLVSGITTEPTLDTAVTLIDPTTGEPVVGKYQLVYDAENGAVKVAKGGGIVPIAVNVTWGNLGSAERGVVTNSDGKFGYSPWTVNFSVDDNIVSGLPSRYGFVTIKSLKLMKRSDGANVPTSATLQQGDFSVTSGAPATESNVKAYDTNGGVAVTRDAAVFTFDSAVKFDASKNVSLILNGANGSSVMRPANSLMGLTASGKTWSPLLEFTCDEYAARVEPVYLLNYYHADGQQQAGWLNYTQTSGSSIPAQTTNDVSFAVTYDTGNFKQSVTTACTDNFATGTYVDIHGKTHASLLEEVKASAGVDVSQVLKTGLANGAGGGATAALSGLTPNQRYVVYFGFGVHGPDDPKNGFTLLSGGYGTLDSLDYVVTGAGTGTQVATQYTAFTAGTNVRTANNAMMLVRAVLTPTSDGKVNINLSAGRSALSFVVVSKVSREMTEYAATVDTDTNFDDIVWTPEKPAGGFGADDALTITASGNPTIAFTNAYTTAAQLTVEGAVKFAADDELYDDPILVHKTIATFGKITAPEAGFAALKTGYKGCYTLTAKSIELHAQTKEIISLNIAGGGNSTGTSPEAHKVTGTAFAGLAPVQGNTWINQTDTWGGGNATKNFPAIVATDDGVTTVAKSGISATCAAYNTYLWNTATDAFLKGYLDDGGNHARVTVTGIPYPTYNVIVYAATDSASGGKFTAPTVNGVTYTCGSDGIATAGSSAWGTAKQLKAAFGVNAMIVTNQTAATLTIVGGANSGGNRGGIAAVQIIATSDPIVIKQPFSLILAKDDNWVDAPWKDANGLPVSAGYWDSAVSSACITGTPNVAATLTLSKVLNLAALSVVGGTHDYPVGISDTADGLAATAISLDANAALMMINTSGNKLWKIIGKGATSDLTIQCNGGLGMSTGSQFRNVTLNVRSSDSAKFYMEQRSESEILTDETVDLVLADGSVTIMDGGESHSTILNVGTLSGGGSLPSGGYSHGKLHVHESAATTFSGACGIPLIVSGAEKLTLSGAVTGALTINGGATVALTGSAAPSSIANAGTVELGYAGEKAFTALNITGAGLIRVASGTLTAALGSLTNNIEVASGATLNLTGTLEGEEVTITTGTLTLTTGANVTVNGAAIPGGWEIKDGKIVRIHWKYPLIYTIAASETSFTTTGAEWKDSSVPPRIYTGGFDSKIESMIVDGISLTSGSVCWMNNVTSLAVGTLKFAYFWGGEVTVSNATDCAIAADVIDCLDDGVCANEQTIHLQFNTGNASIIPGQDTRLYCPGSGPITFVNSVAVLTLVAGDGAEFTYSGAISGAGNIIKDGTGKVSLTGCVANTIDTTVKAGTLTIASGALDDVTLKSGSTLDVIISGGLVSGQTYEIVTGTLTEEQGSVITVNGAALPAGWARVGKVIRELATKPFLFIIAGAQGDVNWTNANWVGANGCSVLPSQWSEQNVTAVIRGGAGDTARMVVDTTLNLSTLTVETTEKVVLALSPSPSPSPSLTVASLSVASGYQVALESGVSVTTYGVAAGGHIHFLKTDEVTSPIVSTAGAMVSYKNANFTTAPTDYSWILRVEDGDSVTMSSVTQFFPIDVRGGTLTLGGATAVGEYIYGGKNGGGDNTNSVITVNGGRVVANINGTATTGSSNRGFIYGCTASNIKQHPTIIVNSGEFDISNGILSPWEFGELEVNGGVLKAKGICKGGNYGGTFALNGGELKIGEKGLSIRGSTFPMTVGGDAKITSTAAMSVSLPTTIGLGHTLTFNAAAGDINAAAANIDNWGAVVVEAGNVNLGTCRGYIDVQGTASVKLYETINDGGEITIKAADSNNVTIVRSDGTTAIDDVKAKDNGDGTFTYSFTPQLDGKVCWWDYEFNGNADNTGTEGGGFSWDDDRPFKGNEYTNNALRVPTRPYRSVTWPTEDTTFVIYGKMVSKDNAYQLCFGTKTGNLIFLATGNVASNEVVLCYSNNNNPQVLKTMTVPNAQTANHLYAFTLKTVENKTVIDIYLDGELLESYNVGAKIALGGGFQIASPHGGTVSGYSRTSDNDPATIDFLRVYKCELSAAAMAAYAEQYPYVSPNGWYVREVEGGDVTWDAESQWIKIKTGEEASTTNQPAANATVGLVVDDDTTVTMNFDKDVTYEAMTLGGEGEVTITNATEATGQIKLTGRLTVNTDATIDARAIDVANTPVTIAEGKTLTIDMTREDLDELLQTTVIKLTGAATTGFGSDVDVRTGEIEEIEGRTFMVEPNANQHYEMTVEVVPETVKLGMAINQGEVEFGTKQIDIPLAWTLQLTNSTAQVLEDGNVTKTTVAAALNDETVENGIKPWESYVLTLSPTNAASKPVPLPVQTKDPTTLTLNLGNVVVREAVKDQVNVGYKVIISDTAGGAGTEVVVENPSAAVLDLPGSGVKYYRYNINITPKP